MLPATVDALRYQGAALLRTIDDPAQAHELRVVACSGIGMVLFYVPDD